MATTITSRPEADIQTGVASYYVPSHNPIVYTLQRADYQVDSIEQNGANAELVLSAGEGDKSGDFDIGDLLYFSSSLYTNSQASVLGVTFTSGATRVQIDESYIGQTDTGSYISNNLTKFPAFGVEIDVWADGSKVGSFLASASSTGLIKADLSAMVSTVLNGETANTYTADTFPDTGALAPFYIVFREKNGLTSADTSDSGNLRYAVWGARQIGDSSGNNMAGYVGITGILNQDSLPNFLTLFDNPTYYEGYPFTLSYLIQDTGNNYDFLRWEDSGGSISQTAIAPSFTAVNRLSLMGSYTSESVDVKITGSSSGNSVPVASNVTISGDTTVSQEGTIFTGAYDYTDADNDVEAGSVLEFLRADDASGTNATVVQTGSLTYTVPTGQEGKYYAFRVTPGAGTGSTPGTAVTTAYEGPILELALSLTHDKQTSFDIGISGGSGIIDWGDSSTTTFDATGSLSNPTKTYASSGTYTVKVFCTPSDITSLDISSAQVITLDISDLSSLASLSGNSNKFTSITTGSGSGTWTTFRIDSSTGSISSLDLSGYTALGGDFRVSGNSSLATITWPSSTSSTFTTFDVSSTSITSLALDWADFSSSCVVDCESTSITSLGPFAATSGTFGGINANFCTSLGGTVDVSPIGSNYAGYLLLASSNVTGVTFASGTLTGLRLDGSDITSLSITAPSAISGQIWFHNQGSATSLTAATMPSSSGTITGFSAHSNLNMGYIDLSGLTFSTTCQIYLHANNWSAAVVNQVLVDLESTLGTGTGSNLIWINGSNAAPDSSSGGYDGSAAVTALSGRGWNLSTN